MENQLICPKCGTIAVPQSKFCANCGNLLLSELTHIPVLRQTWIYFVSIFLPPFGFIWTFKYFRSQNPQLRRIAIIALVLTIVSLIFSIWFTIGFYQSIQSQINSYQNLGI